MPSIPAMYRKARAVVLRHGAPRQDADDIVQEAFTRLAAYTRAHEVRSEEAFLVRAAVNLTLDERRRREASPFEPGSVDLERIADGTPAPEEAIRAQERLRRAAAGLEQLTPLARRALLAHRLDGISIPALARREGMSVAAMEKQVARAVIFLVKWMDGW